MCVYTRDPTEKSTEPKIKVKGKSMRLLKISHHTPHYRVVEAKNSVEGVKIFKTYMNMMSEKVLILLCVRMYIALFPSIASHIYTRIRKKFLSFNSFLLRKCVYTADAVLML